MNSSIEDSLETKLSQLASSTQSTRRSILNKFFQHAGHKSDYDEDDAIKFIEWANQHYNRSSIHNVYNSVIWFYKKVLKKDISEYVKKPRYKPYKAPLMSRDDVVKFIKAAKEMNPLPKALAALSTIYGVRREEMGVEPEDIDLDNSMLYIKSVKDGDSRWVLIPSQAYHVFLFWKVQHQNASSVKRSAFFHKICHHADIDVAKYGDRVGWHSIRRRLILELTYREVNDYALSAFLRWSHSTDQFKTLEHYRGHSADDIEIIENVDKTVFSVHPFLDQWK